MKIIKVKPIYDIFSTKKNNSSVSIEKKPVVQIDYREKNSLVPSELSSLGLELEFKELKVADFLVRDVAIERKTISDFISSMMNKRIIRQIEELQQYEKKLLIIEGTEEQELYSDDNLRGLHPNSIRGFLLSILLKHHIPILFTKDYRDTARFINLIARKKEHEMSTRAIKKSKNQNEQLQYILEGFPGIGPKSARKLLQEFKSIKNIINAPENELEKILGKKTEIIKKIIEADYFEKNISENPLEE